MESSEVYRKPNGVLRVFDERVQFYADRMNKTRLITVIRERRVRRDDFVNYIAAMYPIVTGFNRALLMSMSKLHNVHEASILRRLAEQLLEEQQHNQLYREMLNVYGVDHRRIGDRFEEHVAGFKHSELLCRAMNVVVSLREGRIPAAFPPSEFSEVTLALYALLQESAASPEISFWTHFACQSGIEAVIYAVVSASVYPGIMGRANLDLGMQSLAWWWEHADHSSRHSELRNDEEKHLAISRLILARNVQDPTLKAMIADHLDQSLELFSATPNF